MPKDQLSKKHCRECKKEILVAEFAPHPKKKDATGMVARRWDSDEVGETYWVGWICNECAWRLMREGGSIGGFDEFIYADNQTMTPDDTYDREMARLFDEEEFEAYWEGNCGMDQSGQCSMAGSEECDFECPYNH